MVFQLQNSDLVSHWALALPGNVKLQNPRSSHPYVNVLHVLPLALQILGAIHSHRSVAPPRYKQLALSVAVKQDVDVGANEGEPDGDMVGCWEGLAVGVLVGEKVGTEVVGDLEGVLVGDLEGLCVGLSVGFRDGRNVGEDDGVIVGKVVGGTVVG